MSRKKKTKEELYLKKPVDANVEMSFAAEHEAHNVKSDNTKLFTMNFSGWDTSNYKVTHTNDTGEDEVLIDEEIKFDVELKEDAQYLKLFNFDYMKTKLLSGGTISDICNDMRDFIKNNKDTNPDLVQRAISQLLGCANKLYDEGTDNILRRSGFTRTSQGDTTEEILQKALNVPDGEQLHGFVCSTISEFGMTLLSECGIEAAMLAGGTSSSNHTTLLWKKSDGQYVLSNYKDSYTLPASNIKDAAMEVYRNYYGLLNNGFMYFIDESGSHNECILKYDAMWGDELDKRDYNNQSVFNHNIASKPSINGNIQISNLGSFSAEVKGTIAYGGEFVSKETSYSVGAKKSKFTPLADSSMSVGFKLEHKSETLRPKGKRYSETKFIADYTQLHTDGKDVNVDYYVPMTGKRTFVDKEQEQRLKDYFAKEYEENTSLKSYQNKYNLEEVYLKEVLEMGTLEDAPISKEEYINNYRAEIRNGDGWTYDMLNESTQRNIDIAANREWENYIVNNHYNGAVEILQNRLADTKDHIDNYEQYKQEYILERLNSISNVSIGEPSDLSANAKGFDISHLTTFVRKVFGWEKTLLNDKNVKLTQGTQVSGSLAFNDVLSYKYGDDSTKAVFLAFGGDMRLAAEGGLKLDIFNHNTFSSTEVSGGITSDFSLKTGELNPTINPGLKLNGATSLNTRLNKNTTFGAGISGYAVDTRSSVDYGANAQVKGSYKLNNSDITLFGAISNGLEKQRIRIGGFNEETENVSTLGVTLGAQVGKKGTVSINYSNKDDKLNATRNRTVISVNAKMNL